MEMAQANAAPFFLATDEHRLNADFKPVRAGIFAENSKPKFPSSVGAKSSVGRSVTDGGGHKTFSTIRNPQSPIRKGNAGDASQRFAATLGIDSDKLAACGKFDSRR
jgi:hypothetical protein